MGKLRVGLIGASPTGSWGSSAHIPALKALDQFELTAVSTAHPETASQTAERFSIPHAFSDPRALAEHPEVDIVSIAVRVPAHRELVEIALAAGKHVYCEWPLGRDTAEAKELRDKADAAGVTHMTGLQARQAPVIAHVRELIAEGAIGKVTAANLTHSVPWTMRGRAGSTYLLDHDSGATFLSIPGGHSIDLLSWLFGEFTSLSASLATLSNEAAEAGIARPSIDQAMVSGTIGSSIVASMRLQGSSGFGTGMRLEIGGTTGDLVLSTVPGGRGIQMSDLRLERATGLGKLEAVETPERFFGVPEVIRRNPALNVARSYLAFHEAITEGRRASPNFGDAVIRHQTLDAIERSHAEGRRLTLDPNQTT